MVIFGTGGMSHQLQGKRFGFMNEKFDRWFLDELEKNPENLASLTHHKIMEEAGAEAVELIMWLTMRGALSPKAKRISNTPRPTLLWPARNETWPKRTMPEPSL